MPLRILPWFVALAALCISAERSVAQSAARGPEANVIIVLVDDQGYGDLSCHGNPVLKTPHLDRLSQQSIRLTDFHVSPMCTPTRAQLMTGMDALRSGAMNVSSGRTLLRQDLSTMADIFADAGYRTGIFGKWHLGDTCPYRPEDRGFQETLWFPSSHIGAVPDAWNNDYFNDRYRHNGRLERFEGYCTDVFFGEAIRWMRRCQADQQPFFAYLPLNAAHSPWFVPDRYRESYRKLRRKLASFFGMVANIDENMGRLESMLRETGLDKNTILIFLTDNGGTVGVKLFNAGMRGSKVTLWEGGHRVPCFIRWPAKGLGGGRDIDELTHCQDLLPTLIELCGLKTPEGAKFDGVSLAPLLHGETDRLADRMLVVQFSRMNRPRPKKWDAAVLWRKWRLLEGKKLYDVATDPGQEKNVIEAHPDVAARMRAHYESWWRTIEPRLDRFEPVHIGSSKENPTLLSSCEWADVFLDQGYQVRRGVRKNGLWNVQVEQEGEYEFALRRWPEDADAALSEGAPAHDGEDGDYPAGVALPITAARIRVGEEEATVPVGPDDRQAVFTMSLPAGRTTLQTWFYDRNGREICGAYYVYARYKAPSSHAKNPGKRPPNIVLIMADDQGWGDMAYNGHPVLKTPNFDTMAAAGMRFDRFYAAAPVCSPTRGSVMTGRHPNRFGCFQWGHPLRPQETTIAEALKTAGYVTGHFGKWHLGSVRKGSPVNPGTSGFDVWFSSPNYFDNNPVLSREGVAVQTRGESSMVTVDAALEFIREQVGGSKPFLAVVWFGSPHKPHRAIDKDRAHYGDPKTKNKKEKRLQNFYGEITGMDRAFGKLRNELRTLGIQENTILWYCSDNGGLPGVGRTGGRGCKGEVYEGGLRVPAILEWPAKLQKPQTTTVPCSTSDIYPTILEIAGVQLEDQTPLDGISLVPLLDQKMNARPKPIGFWDCPIRGIGTPSRKWMAELLKVQQAGKESPLTARLRLNAGKIVKQYPDDSFPGHAAWLDWPWKLHRIQRKDAADVTLELYNLAKDPKEEENLATREKRRVDTMKGQLEAWQASVVHSLNGGDNKAFSPPKGPSSHAKPRPNILFIMADDHCQAAKSCYGGKLIETPNIDRLAREGIKFTHMTASNSLCAPSRAVLLTGKYSHKNGLRGNRDRFDGSQQTFPKLLQEAGFATAIVGKWHLKSKPTGFDYYSIMPGQGRFFNCPMKESGKPWKDGRRGGKVRDGYLTDEITDISIEWLKHRDRSKPFCLMVHHKAPHGPHDPAPRHRTLFKDRTLVEPATLLDDYKERAPENIANRLRESRMALCPYPQYRAEVARFKGNRKQATRHMYQTFMKGYLRLVASLDENVGRLLDYLDESGLSENTIIVYTSDNGFFNGEHGFFNKMWMYEPSLHLPLVVRWPDKIQPGATNHELVSMIDLAPTFLDLARAEIPQDMQGQSFRPLLKGDATQWRDAIYYHYYGQYHVPEHFGVRTTTNKLVHYPALDEDHRWELFDLENDQQEMHNLYGDPRFRAVSDELKAKLAALFEKYQDEVSVNNK